MTDLDDAVFQVKAMIENKLDSVEVAKEKLDKLIFLKKLKEKRLSGEKLNDEEIRQAMTLLCWNHFSGCCSPKKDCPWHKAVCDTLGVTPKQVYEVKMKAVNRLLAISYEE